MEIKIKKLNEEAVIPTNGSKYAAGYDLYANIPQEDIIINSGEVAKIGTGISLEIPENYMGLIFARSGLSTKQGLRPANCVGVIDADYRGEICVALYNDSGEARNVHNKDRIAQIAIVPYVSAEFIEVKELADSERGAGGFGSTGVGLVNE